jgi:hypothetical protein
MPSRAFMKPIPQMVKKQAFQNIGSFPEFFVSLLLLVSGSM